jgi:aminoglycoside/choline kinase family phosphotransferase
VIQESSAAPAVSPDPRLDQLKRWLTDGLGMSVISIAPASSDASFRRYFRVQQAEDSLIVMDAPPQHEDCRPFLAVAWLLRDLGLHVPEVLEVDLEQGFLLLSDLGDRRYLDALDANSVDTLYGDAMEALERLQTRGPRQASALPAYDRPMLLREMALFPDWLLERHLELSLSQAQRAVLEESFALLAEVALEQPRVCVHRDYHSRNLMVLSADNPGVLDFQDAVLGPLTYDLVSLLRDCYIAWPREQVEAWAVAYLERPAIRELVGPVAAETWLRWFDFMGLQRHLKASGIFARLWHRDGKRGYLNDIPRTLRYMLQVTSVYPELERLHGLLEELVAPRLLE